MTDCLFCSISAGDIPADIVLRTPDYVAFRDINPQAPIHILIIPVEHYENISALGTHNPVLAGGLVAAAEMVAQEVGLTDYRLVFNTGSAAGQTVFHVHGHILGGRDLNWPPG